jgi:hypothetical protein
MARDLVGRIGRNPRHSTVSEHSLPQVGQERTDVQRRDSKGGNEGRDGITVTYDIWRTVEDTGMMGKGNNLPDGNREL